MSKTILCLSTFFILFSFKMPPSRLYRDVTSVHFGFRMSDVELKQYAEIPNPTVQIGEPIVLTSLDEIPFSMPIDAKNRSNELANAQKESEKWSHEQKSHVAYWQQNHIIRWNELARELIAAHNVPPRCLPDSSGYPTPSREHAADLPRFPFANPPYAARVFAYVSVAQHDAFLAARFYQSKFQKSNPAVYPPDDAVMDAATAEVLTFMFPAETDFIAQKAEIARQSIFSTSKYTPNELAAANALGKAIAQKVLAKAKADGMETAQGSTSLWQQALNRRAQTGEMTWESIQKPIRSPIEPFFGNVKPWFVKDIATFRPSPPPPTHSDELKKEVELVKSYSQVPTKERMRIAVRWADPEFTHTPIGHWNQIACDLLVKNKSDDAKKVRILAALNRALMDALIVCWEAKTYYCYPRPSQVDKDIHARLPLPNFPSYPSGHSTVSGAAATVLGHFFPDESKHLFEMAEEASMSRVYSALHFKMDCDAGMAAGKKVGELVNW